MNGCVHKPGTVTASLLPWRKNVEKKPLILCSVDLFDVRKKVSAFAKEYAAAIGADIAVVFVVSPKPALYGMGAANLSGFINVDIPTDEYTARFDAYVEETFKGFTVKKIMKIGPAADSILECAKLHHVQAIVIGTHGRKNLDRLIFGSVASQVVAGAGAIPVITIGTDK